MRKNLLSMTAVAALLALPVMAQNTSTPRDGTPGNPPSTATQRAADSATGGNTPADGTSGNPPGTALGRAADRALGTNMTGAYPQNSDGTASNPSGTAASRAADRATNDTGTGNAARSGTMGMTHAAQSDRASKVIGSNVYNDRNETIGSVDDLLIGTGNAPTAILSVGGFLGIGAKLVSVPFDQLRWNGENDRWVLNGVTKESLTALPSFSYDATRNRG
ncbi:PRC-barrel domain-containing protein [Roseomonas gilardii]|uniref:PRC-barrel domain-containing protein n=1 Tax=Roseomonas gilardii TaxID=257708 RepID=UPI0004B04AB8|nr:PRC-barrel domain-containing protein [Roseomonas gilardii]SUE44905.1 PRC-barrel domain [Roseomonas gilardii subsp. rosea]